MQLRAKVLLSQSCDEEMPTIYLQNDTPIVSSTSSFDDSSRKSFTSRAERAGKRVTGVLEFFKKKNISNFTLGIDLYFRNAPIDLEYKTFIPLLINKMGKYKSLLVAHFLLQHLRIHMPKPPAVSSESLLQVEVLNCSRFNEWKGYDGDNYQYTVSLTENSCRKFYTSTEKERNTQNAPPQNEKMELLGDNTHIASFILKKVFSNYYVRGLEEPDIPLMQLGADSLILAEISRALSKELCTQVSVLDIFTCATFNSLREYINDTIPSFGGNSNKFFSG